MKLYLKNTFCLVLLSAIFSLSAQAAEYGNQRRRNDRQSEQEERMDQRRQEADEEFKPLEDALKQLLQQIEQNRRPAPDQVEKASELLESNKRNAQVLDEKQKAEYMLLEAWTGFSKGDAPTAFNWSIKACRTDPDNQDAWISQGLFSMLNGKAPQQPRPPKPERQRQNNYNYGNRRRDEEAARPEPKVDMASLYGRRGVLDFDMTTLRPDVLREQIGRFEYLAADGRKVEFKPGRDTLCALFWQSDEEIDDPNNLTAAAARQLKKEDQEEFEVPAELTIEKQRQYFQILFEECKKDETIKFLQINTTVPKNYDQFMQSLPAYTDIPYPTVVAAASESNAQSIAGTNAKIPFMLIADKKGDVKYAGPAKYFMPAFILTEITGVPINLREHGQGRRPGTFEHDPMLEELMRSHQRPNSVKTDPNAPAADPNAVAQQVMQTTPKPNTPAKTYRELSLEDQVTATNLLNRAKLSIEPKRIMRGGNPSDGVEACRIILKDYPGSEYEDQARELLRMVPERWKRDLKITPEELGIF